MPHKDTEVRKAWQKEYREKTKELQKEYQRQYRKLNADSIIKYKQEWYKSKRKDKVLKTYGVTLDYIHAMIVAQDSKCKICETTFTDKIRPYIDHCHTTLQVRGILCMNCNTGLGHFKDNYKFLLKAARYVR